MVSCYTAEEIAQILKININTLYKYFKLNMFHFTPVRIGRKYYVSKDVFDNFILGQNEMPHQ